MKKIIVLDHNFEVRKDNKVYKMFEPKTGLQVSQGYKTIKECIEKDTLKIINISKTPKELKIVIIKNKNRERKNKILLSDKINYRFKKYFKTELTCFIDNMLGFPYFDIIKFDTKFLRTPDGISTKDYITKKYSQQASNFIRALNKL